MGTNCLQLAGNKKRLRKINTKKGGILELTWNGTNPVWFGNRKGRRSCHREQKPRPGEERGGRKEGKPDRLRPSGDGERFRLHSPAMAMAALRRRRRLNGSPAANLQNCRLLFPTFGEEIGGSSRSDGQLVTDKRKISENYNNIIF